MPIPNISQYSTAQKAAATLIRSFWLNYACDAVAVGFVANACREDAFIVKAVGDHDTAYSIGQWHWQPRGANILKGCGIDVRTCTLENALVAMHWELTAGTEKNAWAAIRACTTVESAAIAICRYYERAGAKNALNLSATYASMWQAYFANQKV
jgi:hypothetical protein